MATQTPAESADRRRDALNAAMNQIRKLYGPGSILRLGDQRVMKVKALSTGSLALDIQLGVGGLPLGRIVEFYGPEGGGKTTLALHVLAEAQKRGMEAAIIDAEHALDPDYARALGCDPDALLVAQPEYGEQGLEIADHLVRSGAVGAIVVDSVAALVPKNELEGDMGQQHVGLQARLMSQALRKIAGSINRAQCVVVFINQIREKIGVMFGSPETTPGGRALKYYASVRLRVSKLETIKRGDEAIGHRLKVEVRKNKVAAPFRRAETDLIYGAGISREGDLLDLGMEYKLVAKSGSWFSYGETRLGQGRENARQFLGDHAELADELELKIREAAGLTNLDADGDAPADEDNSGGEE